MGEPNWAYLVNQNRAKSMGVSWNEKEQNAIYNLKIPADYVRRGILTYEDYAEQKKEETKKKKKPLFALPIEKILEIANKEGIKITPQMNKDAIISEIRIKRKMDYRNLIRQGKDKLIEIANERKIPLPEKKLNVLQLASLIRNYELKQLKKKSGAVALKPSI